MSDVGDDTIIGRLKQQIEMEGYKESTPAWDRRLDQVKVLQCREMRGHFVCSECQHYDECELVKKVMRAHRGILDTEPETPSEE